MPLVLPFQKSKSHIMQKMSWSMISDFLKKNCIKFNNLGFIVGKKVVCDHLLTGITNNFDLIAIFIFTYYRILVIIF